MSLPSAAAFIRALRPRQWIKNTLVAAAPIAAGSLDERDVVLRTVAAFVVFVAASGAAYLFNDTVDVEVDQAHPSKRLRPVAAGEISVGAAWIGAAVLATAALIASALLEPEFGVVIAVYLAINLAYSLKIKHWPWVELVAISSGFILRAVGGGAATDTPLSGWFVVVVCAAALFVVAGKRSAELRRTAGNGGRNVLQHYSARGLLQFRAVTAAVAVVAYTLWVLRQDLAIDWLAALSLLPFAGSLALYSAAIDGGLGEDPEDIALRYRPFQIAAACWVIVYGLGVYG